jgi:hypothetical protein
MSKRSRCTAAGVGLALSLALSATPAAQAVPSRVHRVVAARPSLFTVLWSYLVGSNPYDPRPTQGPTVDPNGVH